MKLLLYGSENLSQSEHAVIESVSEEEEKYLREIEAQMLAVITEFGLSGLAAPQLGFGIQMVTVKLGDGSRLTLLNPTIERMYGSETEYSEGCISFPPGGNQCPVARMQFINVMASTIERPGEKRDFQFSSRDARVVQHEVDHLNGVFFFDRAELVEKHKALERFNLWKRTFKQSPKFGLEGGKNGRPTGIPQAQHS